jgi:hypothetical protein
MMDAFYKITPTLDTPYRQLTLDSDGNAGWQVRLIGGTKWGRQNTQDLDAVHVLTFDRGREIYYKIYSELQAEGWKVYTPQARWCIT